MKLLQSILFFVLLAYLAACAWLYFSQRSLLYVPTPDSGHVNAERISLAVEGETLRIWHAGAGEKDAVIYFGGNAEDVGLNIPALTQALPNRPIYLVNYRGYGGSTGMPTEAGLFGDAIAVFDFVQARHGHVAVIGRSLGSGVAAYLASVRPVQKLVLVTPYDSIESVASAQFPYFPVSLLLKDRFASVQRVPSIKAPTMVFVAEQDVVVPRVHSDTLVKAFPAAQVSVAMVPGTDHNSIGGSAAYLKQLGEFL